MPKQKTHSGSKKRFSVTASGRVKCAKCNKNHILNKKTRKRKRSLRQGGYVDATKEATVLGMIYNKA